MDLVCIFLSVLELILDTISTPMIFILLVFILIVYHLLLYVVRDRKYLLDFRKWYDANPIPMNKLKEFPLVNFIIPAWEEGEVFKGCLTNLTQLKYPNLRAIVNAGGSKETIEIANSFKKNDTFTIVYQEKGGGKIKAINDCLSYIEEGLIFIMDADVYVSDYDLLKMVAKIVIDSESIVNCGLKPHKSQVHKISVRYLIINRNAWFRKKRAISNHKAVGPCALLTLDVIKSVGRFTEKRLIGDGDSMGSDVIKHNYTIFQLISGGIESITYPVKIREYLSQNIRWLQNFYYNKFKTKGKIILNYLIFLIMSVYLFVFPFLLLLNVGLFLLGILLILNIYLKKLRKVLFFRLTYDRAFYGKTKLSFYIIIIFYIYLDSIITIYTFFEILVIGKKRFKKRKNIE